MPVPRRPKQPQRKPRCPWLLTCESTQPYWCIMTFLLGSSLGVDFSIVCHAIFARPSESKQDTLRFFAISNVRTRVALDVIDASVFILRCKNVSKVDVRRLDQIDVVALANEFV